MQMHSGGRSTTHVCTDANAVIDYIRERLLHVSGMPPTGRRADVMRQCLDQLPSVFVPETAAIEAERNISKDLIQKLGHEKAQRVLGPAQMMLSEYLEHVQRKDELEHVSTARKMYASISNDPENPKLVTWKKKKGRLVEDPVLGSDINDLKILSTAAHYAQMYTVELWTHDMDFTIFADKIRRTFGLKVVDTYRLGTRFL